MDTISIITLFCVIIFLFSSIVVASIISKHNKKKKPKKGSYSPFFGSYNDIFFELKSNVGGINGEYESPSKTSTSTVLVKISV